jgi:hypothetical protein
MTRQKISRRHLLRSLGAAAATASSIIPSRLLGQPHSERLASPRVQFIDMSYPSTDSLQSIRKAGVKTIGRYYSRPADGTACSVPGKILTQQELTAIERDPEMSVVTAFQYCNRCGGFGGSIRDQAAAIQYVQTKGKTDAQYAVGLAGALKQPKGTPIYFGADFNPAGDCKQSIENRDMNARIIAYFKEVNDIVKPKGWKVGVYGFGGACRLLKDHNPRLAEYFWLSASLSHQGHMEFFNSGDWHIFQSRTDLKNFSFAPGVEDVDTDVVNPDKEDVGQWRTDRIIKVDRTAAIAILDGRFFLTKRLCGYKDKQLKIPIEFSNIIFGRPARILQRDTNVIAATFKENNTPEFYIRPSDVVLGLKGNMPDWNADNDKHFACSA